MKNWVVALLIFITYVLFQITSILLAPELILYFSSKGFIEVDAVSKGYAWTLFITQGISMLIISMMLANNKRFIPVFSGGGTGILGALLWGVIGFFLAMAGQILGAAIESIFGVTIGSENTEVLSNIAKNAPIIIFPMVLFAPFLEEVVFRRIIFGGLVIRTNFILAAFISAIIFALVHGEPQHILMYLLPGLAFAFVYYKTKRLLAPITAHLLMNSYVTILQLNADKLKQLQDMPMDLMIFLQ